MKIGYCVNNDGSAYIVLWVVGDRITIPATGCLIATDTRNKEEALEICRRNLKNFVKA